MTITEYLDPKRFPLTTQGYKDPKDQLLMDAFNYDQMKEHLDNGGSFTDEEKQWFVEFEEKMNHNARLTGELAQGMSGGAE